MWVKMEMHCAHLAYQFDNDQNTSLVEWDKFRFDLKFEIIFPYESLSIDMLE